MDSLTSQKKYLRQSPFHTRARREGDETNERLNTTKMWMPSVPYYFQADSAAPRPEDGGGAAAPARRRARPRAHRKEGRPGEEEAQPPVIEPAGQVRVFFIGIVLSRHTFYLQLSQQDMIAESKKISSIYFEYPSFWQKNNIARSYAKEKDC